MRKSTPAPVDQLSLFSIPAPRTEPIDPKITEILDIRRDRFRSRRDRRIDNANDRAASNRRFATSYSKQSSDMARCIPFGQPILIGHHSEGRDRRFRSRMRGAMDKSVEASKKADYYEAKVTAIENNIAIFSDDPDAIVKLQAKIDTALAEQENWKAGNKIVKSKKLTIEQKIDQLTDAGHCPSILTPDFCGRIGYADYLLTNNNANIRRMRLRLEQLSRTLIKAVELGDSETKYPDLDLVVKNARTIDRLQLIFSGKPSLEIRTLLKSSGFRWAPSESAWQRKLPESDFVEKHIITAISNIPRNCNV